MSDIDDDRPDPDEIDGCDEPDDEVEGDDGLSRWATGSAALTLAVLAACGDPDRYFAAQKWGDERTRQWRESHPDDDRSDLELAIAQDGPFEEEWRRDAENRRSGVEVHG